MEDKTTQLTTEVQKHIGQLAMQVLEQQITIAKLKKEIESLKENK